MHIDDELLDESYLPPETPTFVVVDRPVSVTVPDGYIFIMGDNRNRALDSRFFGPIPEDAIEANSMWVLWSNN